MGVLRAMREFRYDVGRVIGPSAAVDEFETTLADVMNANSSILRLCEWWILRIRLDERKQLARRIGEAEVSVIAAIERCRPR